MKADIVPVEVPAGGCAFHHGGTWHGSDMNRGDRPRRSVVAHCMSSEAQFHPTNVSYIYNRYKRHGDAGDGRELLPDPVAPGRLPHALARLIVSPHDASTGVT